MAIKQAYQEKALLIFLLPPMFDDLLKRLRIRGTESESEMEKRMATAKLEMQYANEYDYKVINDEVARAASEILLIVDRNERRVWYEKRHR